MYVGHELNKSVPEMLEMNLSEFVLWRAFFNIRAREQQEAQNRANRHR